MNGMKKRCEYCGGSQRIFIYPNYREISMEPDDPTKQAVSAKEFICPNCGDTAVEGKIRVLKVEARYPLDPQLQHDTKYLAHIRKDMAYGLMKEMLNQDLVKFFETPSEQDDQFRFTWEKVARARVGVVDPRAVQTLEERITKNQDEQADAAIAAVVEQLRYASWLSPGQSDLVVDTLKRAVQDMRVRRDAMKEIENADRLPTPRNPRS